MPGISNLCRLEAVVVSPAADAATVASPLLRFKPEELEERAVIILLLDPMRTIVLSTCSEQSIAKCSVQPGLWLRILLLTQS